MTLEMIERTIPLKPWMVDYSFILVQSIQELENIINRAILSEICAFDLESTGLDTRVFNGVCKSYVVGYSLSFEDKIGYYIPIRHNVETDRGKNLDPILVNDLIQKLLLEAKSIVGHNWLKYDSEILLASEKIDIRNPKGNIYPDHDTYILARLQGKKPANLKYLSKTLLDKEMIELKDILPSSSKGNMNFASVSPYEGTAYAASDAICTRELYLLPEIQKPITEQPLIYNIERKVFRVVRKMERNRVKLDVDFCKKLDSEMIQTISDLEHSMHEEVSLKTNGQIKTFQLDSPDEVSKILFEIYDMNPKPEKGKKGNYTTNDETLEKLVANYPLAKKLQDYREVTKFHRTYIKNMILNVDEEGYLKFNFAPLQTDSGRFASPGRSDEGEGIDGYSGVNVQSSPARYDKSKPNVRKCISCEEDEVIAALDWSGVEIRVGTNMSGEPIWVDRFINGDGDVHTSTASIIFDKPESVIDKQERQISKMFNFQTLYGGSAGTLASMLNLTYEDAKKKQDRYFGKLKTIKAWIRSKHAETEKTGFCLTQFGRKRFLPQIFSEDPKIKAGAQRQSVNTPIQGTSADLMKLAMIYIDRYIEENKLDDDIQMLLTMHDELVFRLKKNKVDIINDIANIMKLDSVVKSVKWKVPLAVDVEIGSSWDVQYEYKDMLKFLREKKGVDNVAYIYSKEVDYDLIYNEFSAYQKEKKENKKVEEKTPIDKAKEARKEFKSTVEQMMGKIPELNTTPSIEKDTVTSKVDDAFAVLKNVSLQDLPEDAYNILKKNFYNKEIIRILAGDPSEDDQDIEFIFIVHNPIDNAKKHMIGFIIDSCVGRGRVKLMSQDKEELHEGWLNVDVLKMAVMCKIFNL